MKEFIMITGGTLGALAVIFGAFGAHALKRQLNAEQLKSFETGVKYQMYHALILIISGLTFPFLDTLQQVMVWCFILGIVLFSFSIYGLVLSDARGAKIRILGPVTPLGGLLLVFGWVLFVVNITKMSAFL